MSRKRIDRSLRTDDFTDAVALGTVREWLFDRAREGGAVCACCGQWTEVKRRPIYAAMVTNLRKLARASAPGEFVHLPTVTGINGGDTAKLRAWGLIEEELRTREDGGHAGYWRVTDLGRDWLAGSVTVPSHAYFFNRQVLGVPDGRAVTVEDVLQNRRSFDLRDI